MPPFPMQMPPMIPMTRTTSTTTSSSTAATTTTAAAATSTQERSIDPSNDVSNWSEHVTNDGRRYWYNKAIAQSTFEKPLVLKTPEERSIPPCKWKEYSSSDGKKYYSDGTTSLWEAPEEYVTWKARMDQVELKAKAAVAAAASSTSSNGSTAAGYNMGAYQLSDDSIDTSNTHANNGSSYQKSSKSDDIVIPTFATKAEAVAAFKALLEEKKVSVTASIRIVTETCQSDGRWFALKTSGERKQALTEYQTQRQKIEREVQRNKDKKARDSFLMMLAENTDIHSRTRWRDASVLLQDDARYKNVSDEREREDLFNDFVLELEKKEKDDKAKQRTKVLLVLTKIIDNLYDNGSITHKSTWTEMKGTLLQRTQGAEFKALNESDIRKHFEEFLKKQEAVFKEKERMEREEMERELLVKKEPFKRELLKLADDGKINVNTRWRELLEHGIDAWDSYQSLLSFYQSKDTRAVGITGEPRDAFDSILSDVRNDFKVDKRVVKDFLYDTQLDILKDTPFSVLSDAVRKFINEVAEKSYKATNTSSVAASKSIAITTGNTEEGEEVEDTLNRNRDICSTKLQEMLSKRPANLQIIFDDLVSDAIEEYKEEQKRMARKIERFVQLLEEYFYRSDHVDTTWSDAKKCLSKHSAYDDLPKAERKRLFKEYMTELETKVPSKLKDDTEIGKKRKLDE